MARTCSLKLKSRFTKMISVFFLALVVFDLVVWVVAVEVVVAIYLDWDLVVEAYLAVS